MGHNSGTAHNINHALGLGTAKNVQGSDLALQRDKSLEDELQRSGHQELIVTH